MKQHRTLELKRPGVSSDWLQQNGIHHISAQHARQAVGTEASGLLIPYMDRFAGDANPILDPGDKPFARLRLDVSQGTKKYHQPAGTAVHGYLPDVSDNPRFESEIILVEGEFKSLALTDPKADLGMFSVGLSGFYGFAPKQAEGEMLRLVPEIERALVELKPQTLFYLGDNDTALNPQFADAAIKLRSLLPGIRVLLPRIHLGEPKGIDDVAQEQGAKFSSWFHRRLEEAIELKDQDVDAVRIQLVEAEIQIISKLSSEVRTQVVERLAILAQACGPAARSEITRMVKSAKIMGAMDFKSLIHQAQVALDRRMVSDNQSRIQQALAEVFWDGRVAHFRDANGNWSVRLAGRPDILLHLRRGFGLSLNKLDGVSPAEQALYEIQKRNSIVHAGPIAGRPPGLFQENGHAILVTAGPTIIQPSQTGSTAFIVAFLEQLLGKGFIRDELWQAKLKTFMGWLKHARHGLSHPDEHCPGQLLVLVGPIGIGKSFLQEVIITRLIGGRSADPSDFIFGRTGFNDDLAGAEHHILSDASIEPDDQFRRKFRDRLKAIVANQTQAFSPKNKTRLNFRRFFRISLSTNSDPHSVRVVPTPDGGFQDKEVLLHCYPTEALPTAKDGSTPVDQLVREELPAFINHLDAWTISDEFSDDRFGVAAYHDPAVLSLLHHDDPMRKLGTILTQFVQAQPRGAVEGTALEIHRLLLAANLPDYSEMISTFARLGQHLASLQRELPGWESRITRIGWTPYDANRNRKPIWRITAS